MEWTKRLANLLDRFTNNFADNIRHNFQSNITSSDLFLALTLQPMKHHVQHLSQSPFCSRLICSTRKTFRTQSRRRTNLNDVICGHQINVVARSHCAGKGGTVNRTNWSCHSCCKNFDALQKGETNDEHSFHVITWSCTSSPGVS